MLDIPFGILKVDTKERMRQFVFVVPVAVGTQADVGTLPALPTSSVESLLCANVARHRLFHTYSLQGDL